jgi:hypothetical protein
MNGRQSLPPIRDYSSSWSCSLVSPIPPKEKVAVSLDNILIFMTTLEEHQHFDHEVLDWLEKHDMYLCPGKCKFQRKEIKYLGPVIRQGEVQMDPSKIKAVCNWPEPKNLHKLQGLLGLANFYRCFIQDFSKTADHLTTSQRRITLGDGILLSRRHFPISERPLSLPLSLCFGTPVGRLTYIEVDASGFATGRALLHKLPDGCWHPVAFCSASMQPAESVYDIYDKEILAIILGLQNWHHFLKGLPEPFDIVTDHSNLEFWKGKQVLSA